MSVASSNPFALLGDGDDAPAPTPAPKTTNDAPKTVGGGARGGARGRGESNRGGRGGATTMRAEEGERGARGGRGRGRGGEGRERAPRGGRAGYTGRNRVFDRHSATGKVDSDKKVTQGWGDATTAEEEGEKLAKSDAKEESGEAIEAAVNGDAAVEAEPEPEDSYKTLDEYLAEKAQKSLNVSAPPPRKANEGVDDSQWKDTVKVERAEEEDYYAVSKDPKIRSKQKKEKQHLDIEQRFVEAPRRGGPGRGRGGRGGETSSRGGRYAGAEDAEGRRERPERGEYTPRGGRGRGGEGRGRGGDRGRGAPRGAGRGGRGGANVNLNDTSAFPSLGA